MLPENIDSVEQVRELDRITIEEHGIAGYELMQQAALATFKQPIKVLPCYKSNTSSLWIRLDQLVSTSAKII